MFYIFLRIQQILSATMKLSRERAIWQTLRWRSLLQRDAAVWTECEQPSSHVIAHWCYSSTDRLSCRHYLKQTRYCRGSLGATFLLHIQENEEILLQVALEWMCSYCTIFSVSLSLFLFITFLFHCFHQAVSPLSPLHQTLLCSLPFALLSNLLIAQSVCSSLCNSTTVKYANKEAAYGSFLI